MSNPFILKKYKPTEGLRTMSFVDFVKENGAVSLSRVKLSNGGWKAINMVDAEGMVMGLIFGKRSSELVEIGQKCSRAWRVIIDSNEKPKITISSDFDPVDEAWQD